MKKALSVHETQKPTPDSEQLQRAMMNILEDLSVERAGNVATQNAMMNILEDLQDEVSAKNRFLAILSHELRNPLAPITSTLEYIKHRGTRNRQLRKSIDTIEHQFAVLTRLLKDLLDVARITSNKLQLNFEKISLQTVIDHAIESIQPLLRQARHQLKVTLPAEPILLMADPLRLEQVIVNLLSNSIKYTDPGGKIWLTARPEENEITIVVKDTGMGIRRTMLPRIFHLFAQEDASAARFGGGMGVGLALVRSLVDLHDGSVHATSEGPDQGSTFTVQLPYHLLRHGKNGRVT